jgi:hypothetical protein
VGNIVAVKGRMCAVSLGLGPLRGVELMEARNDFVFDRAGIESGSNSKLLAELFAVDCLPG